MLSAPPKNVVVFRALPPDLLARIESRHRVVCADPRRVEELPRFRAALADAQGLIGSSFRIGAAELDAAPRLEVISSISVGVDNYPLAELARRGIVLCHTPGVLTETTADTIFGLVMCTLRRLPELSQLVRAGRWTRNIGEELFGWDVHGKTIGILGFGRIGQALARRAALGFDMPVRYFDRSTAAPPELQGRAECVPLGRLLAEADIVVCTLPLSQGTRHLMNAAAFAAMKPGAVFVNGSRGGIVDEAALVDALDRGTLRAAGLDVFATEPLPLDSPLRTHPKVTPLPHVGSATHETRRKMAELATDNLLRVLAGEPALTAYDLSGVGG